MKKIFMFLAIVLCAMTINAQDTATEMQNIDKLVEKLNKTLAKTPKETGVKEIDKYTVDCISAANGAVASADTLRNFYKRQIGEPVDGIADVKPSKPTLAQWIGLGERLTEQTAGMAGITTAGADAMKAAKGEKSPMKAAALVKNVKWSSDLLGITGEALAEQAKAVKTIIDTLKSNDNL